MTLSPTAQSFLGTVLDKLPDVSEDEILEYATNSARLSKCPQIEPQHVSEGTQFAHSAPETINMTSWTGLFNSRYKGLRTPIYDRAAQVGYRYLDPQFKRTFELTYKPFKALPKDHRNLIFNWLSRNADIEAWTPTELRRLKRALNLAQRIAKDSGWAVIKSEHIMYALYKVYGKGNL